MGGEGELAFCTIDIPRGLYRDGEFRRTDGTDAMVKWGNAIFSRSIAFFLVRKSEWTTFDLRGRMQDVPEVGLEISNLKPFFFEVRTDILRPSSSIPSLWAAFLFRKSDETQ